MIRSSILIIPAVAGTPVTLTMSATPGRCCKPRWIRSGSAEDFVTLQRGAEQREWHFLAGAVGCGLTIETRDSDDFASPIDYTELLSSGGEEESRTLGDVVI